VAQLWHDRFKWGDSPTPAQVSSNIVDRVIELGATAKPLAGVIEALDMARDRGIRVALCSSSDLKMIEAIVDALGITERFEILHSAENDEFGKPHPMTYLHTAEKLGVDPRDCLVFEDSVTGCVSAKAAGMTVVAVPAPHDRTDVRFGLADVVFGSLSDLSVDVLDRLSAGGIYPSLARPRFHLAVEVDDLDAARHFYGQVLGCAEGRSAPGWVDFDLFGHQVVAHRVATRSARAATNPVDGQDVPGRHFGVLLTVEAWEHLVERLRANRTDFIIEPQTRFAGQAGEQRTCFLLDPAGNALEFKAFVDEQQVFATD
jgi:HAD superfamily hydrolase (TIGR01509 family)